MTGFKTHQTNGWVHPDYSISFNETKKPELAINLKYFNYRFKINFANALSVCVCVWRKKITTVQSTSYSSGKYLEEKNYSDHVCKWQHAKTNMNEIYWKWIDSKIV